MLDERPVIVLAKQHFYGSVEASSVPHGLTIADIVLRTIENRRLIPNLSVMLDDSQRLVPWQIWHLVKPKPGVTVAVIPIPRGGGGEGGGNKAARTALMIGVLAAAIAVPYLAPAAFGIAAGTLGGAAFTAGVGIAGSLAINSLFPPAAVDMGGTGEAPRMYELSGVGNQMRLDQVVPVPLGWHKTVPPLAATPFPERVGDEHRIIFAVAWGVGKVAITDHKIAKTSASLFDSDQVEIEHRLDAANDPALELYPQIVQDDSLTLQLDQVNGYEVRTTPDRTRYIVIELTAPYGMKRTSKNGKDVEDRTVQLDIVYRAAGASAWGAAIAVTMNGNTSLPVYYSKKISFPSIGEYEVGVRRLTADTPEVDQERIFDKVVWTRLQSHSADDPIDAPGVARTAYRIYASEFLNGTIDVSAIVKGGTQEWNGSAWVDGFSRNPAAIARRALTDPLINRRPKTDAQLDLPSFVSWHTRCAAKQWLFNTILDREYSERQILDMVGAVGFARIRYWDGKWRVFEDRADLERVTIVTPRNSWGFQFSRIYQDLPHALRVQIRDQDNDFEEADVLVYADGYSKANATKFENVAPIGITKSSQAQRWGRRTMAAAILRPEVFTFTQDYERLFLAPGRRFGYVGDVPLIGSGSSRVMERTANGGGLTTAVRLDSKIVMDGPDYVLWCRKYDGVRSYELVDFIGETDTFTFKDPVEFGDGPIPSRQELCTVGKAGRDVYDLIVRDIIPVNDYDAKITAVAYAPEIENSGDIPDFDPGITLPVQLYLEPTVLSIRSSDDVWPITSDGNFLPAIAISLGPPSSTTANITKIHVKWRPATGGTTAWSTRSVEADGSVISLQPVESGKRYDIRIRYIFQTSAGNAVGGPWAGPFLHLVERPTTPPPDVAEVWRDGEVIRWDDADRALNHAGWLVRTSLNTNTPWQYAQRVNGGVLTVPHIDLALLPLGYLRVFVKAVTKSGVESLRAAAISINNRGGSGKRHTYAQVDYADAGFPGTISGGQKSIAPSNESWELDAESTGMFLPNPAGMFLEDPAAPFLPGQFAKLVYEFDYAIPSDARDDDVIALEYAIEGLETLESRWVGDALVTPDDDDVLLSAFADGSTLLPNDTAPLLATLLPDPTKPYGIWRGFVQPVPGDVLRFRVTCSGGEVMSSITALLVRLEAMERDDGCTLESGTPGTRASPSTWRKAETFRQLLWVRTTILDDEIPDTPALRPVRVVRLRRNPSFDASVGPLIQAQNADRVGVRALLEVQVGGF